MRFAKLEQPAAEPLDVGLDGFDVIDFEVQARVRQRAFVFLVPGWIDYVQCDFNASEVKLHPAIRLKSGLHVEGAGIECLRAVHVVNIVNHDRAFTMLSFLNTSTGNYSCAPRSRSIVAISSILVLVGCERIENPLPRSTFGTKCEEGSVQIETVVQHVCACTGIGFASKLLHSCFITTLRAVEAVVW